MALVALTRLTVDPDNPVDQLDNTQPFALGRCSFAQPQFCSNQRGLMALTGLRRAGVRAGGNPRFARREWLWHGGTPLVLEYEKRNVLGFSLDFAEDRTGTNWSIESTWENDFTVTDNDEFDGLREVDRYNLTISVDRPTMIGFLNRSRTFFFNSQWFFQYVDGYQNSFTSNGPYNTLATFTASTAYFQDRLISSLTAVYAFDSNSSALLQSFSYRFTDQFRVSVGYRFFAGRTQRKTRSINPASLSNSNAARADRADVNNGISPVRDLDQITLRIRYTF
jgi:hypothetical protein